MSRRPRDGSELVRLAPGGGVASRKPGFGVRCEIADGVLVLLFDRDGKSGGLVHLRESDGEIEARLRKLARTVGAAHPVAKLVGACEPSDVLVSVVRKALGAIPVAAEHFDGSGAVRVSCRPAKGELRYKRPAAGAGKPHSAKAEVVPLAAAPAKKDGRIKVLVVDDAPTIRKLLRLILSRDAAFEIVGEAASAAEADELLKKVRPDVITLDIHMPVEDGVSFLGRLMARTFVPTVIVSSLSMQEGEKVLEALSLGAIDYIQKPKFNDLEEVAEVLCEKLKVASTVREKKGTSRSYAAATKSSAPSRSLLSAGRELVAIGASTGGVQALTEILTALPAEIPPMVIVQHIPPVFSRAFCERLDKICPFTVKEAADGDPVLPGQVLIAPGGLQMKVEKRAGKLVVCVFDGERVNRHKPSVEVLFQSVAKEVGASALGVMLTGMGEDGAVGLLEMRKKGSPTICQDEASSVVWGMPGASVKIGAAERVLPLSQIAGELVKKARAA